MRTNFWPWSAFFIVIFINIMTACTEDKKFDTQGHRGCRGLFPENSIEAMQHALNLGVSTLELDVVITKDKKVVVSHEPFLSHEICSYPDLTPVTVNEERKLNIYQMNYDSLKQYDCGSRPHLRFPEQKKIATSKPLLSELIKSSEQHAKATGRSMPFYNIETKSTMHGDQIFHPSPREFVALLLHEVFEANIEERVIIQSFDVRTLQIIRELHPELKLALLIENKDSYQKNVENLGFTPHVYSCDYSLVTKDLVLFCQKNKMELIPWTVNEKEEMAMLIEMGVDGIITDYPDRLMEVVAAKQLAIK